MNIRQRRVARQVSQILSRILHQEACDPCLRGVHITAVHISADLGVAKIYWLQSQDYDVHKPPEPNQSQQRLLKSVGFFRSSLADHMRLRRIPQLRFYYDHSYDRGHKIEQLINKVRSSV